MSDQPAENIHDKFFRETFAEPKMAAEFLRHYLPPDLAASLDLDRLEVLKDSFVDDQFKEHFSDLLCRARLKDGGTIFVYILIEHKSWPERWVALQLLRYMLKIWEPMPQERGAKLPVIFPLVFYHGSRRWKIARNFNALFDAQALAKVRPYVPDFEYFLCDLSVHSDTQVTGDDSLQAALMALRGVFDQPTVEWLTRLMQLLMNDKKQWKRLKKIFTYLIKTGRVKRDDMQNALNQAEQARRKNGELVRTFLDDYVDIGIKQGREEGREEGALLILLAQLNRRFGPLSQRMQNRVRRLSLKQITELGEALLDFHSRKDISAWLKAHEG